MPVVIGAGGVERIIEIDLNKAEQKMFDKIGGGRAGPDRGLQEDRAASRLEVTRSSDRP